MDSLNELRAARPRIAWSSTRQSHVKEIVMTQIDSPEPKAPSARPQSNSTRVAENSYQNNRDDRDRRSSSRRLAFLAVAASIVVGFGLVGASTFNRTASNQTAQPDNEQTDTASDDVGLDSSTAEIDDTATGPRRAEQAEVVLGKMSDYFDERVNDVIDWSRTSEIRQAADANYPQAEEIQGMSIVEIESRFASNKTLDLSGQSSAFLLSLIEGQTIPRLNGEPGEEPPVYAEVFFTEKNGYVIGATGDTSDFVQSDEEWWTVAMNDGIFIGNLDFDESAGVLAIDVAVRIDDENGQPLGVIKTSIDGSIFASFADEFATEDVDVLAVSATGVLLADTASDHQFVGQDASMQPILDVAQGMAFNAAKSDGKRSGFGTFEKSLTGYATTPDPRSLQYRDVVGEQPGWLVFVEGPAES